MNTTQLTRQTVKLGHRQRATTAQVWLGGTGPALVLLHGAWGGARAHWMPVWEALARHHRLVVPELPGIVSASGSGDAKGHYADYGDWVVDVMDAVQVEQAAIVGNSFGATVAWYVAVQHPARCRSLVLVDGGPPPMLPRWLRVLMLNSALARRVAMARLSRSVFGRQALTDGFHDPDSVPDEVRYTLGSPDERTVAHMLGMALRSGVPSALPTQPTLVVWGAQDRLPQSDPDAGRELQRRIPGARFVEIPEAGHLPQVEQPQRFLDEVMPFIALAG